MAFIHKDRKWMDENVTEQSFAWHGVYDEEIVVLGLTQNIRLLT